MRRLEELEDGAYGGLAGVAVRGSSRVGEVVSRPRPRSPPRRARNCTVAATSWTRTRAAPPAAAQPTAARLPASRSAGGAPVRWPMKLLRLAPTSSGRPSPARASRRREQGEVAVVALAEADAGVEHHLAGIDAGGDGAGGGGRQLRAHLAEQVVVVEAALHGRRARRGCASAPTGSRRRRRRRRGRGRPRALTSLIRSAPAARARPAPPRPCGCRPTAAPSVRRRSSPSTGPSRRPLLVGGHLGRAGAVDPAARAGSTRRRGRADRRPRRAWRSPWATARVALDRTVRRR